MVAPVLHSTSYRASWPSLAPAACTDTAVHLWRGLSRSSEPIRAPLRNQFSSVKAVITHSKHFPEGKKKKPSVMPNCWQIQ